MREILAWLMALPVLPAAQSYAQAPSAPVVLARPDGPVLDQADILPAREEGELDDHLRGYFERTGTAIVVVSVTSLKGQSIETFATELFNHWGIGDARTKRGLLLLVAPGERKVRIEVGCGLEAAITNAIAGDIIQKNILPRYRESDLKGGTLAGVTALEQRLSAARAFGPRSETCKAIMRKAA